MQIRLIHHLIVAVLALACSFQSLNAQGCAPDETPPVPDAGSPLPTDFQEVKKALASDKAHNDNLGYSVSISDNYAIVGAWKESDGVKYQNGAAYIFERDASGNWTEVQKLLASDKNGSDQFGISVSISGDYAIVGANLEDDTGTINNGAAYIFERDALGNWTEVQKLLASNKATSDNFGISVSISGDYAIVGANLEGGVFDYGAAYIFERDALGNWTEVQKLIASDKIAHDYFGYSVSISGGYAIVGAYLKEASGTRDNGAAYIFERDALGNWTEVQKLLASDKATRDYFGYSVSISNDYAIVGAYLESDGTTSANGAAYIFERNTLGNWTEVQKLLASDKNYDDRFGYSVSISDDYAIVGAIFSDDEGRYRNGASYIFERDANGSWTEVQKLLASDKANSDYVGYSVSISGGYALVGAYLQDEGGLRDNGAAYFFETESAWKLPNALDQHCGSNSITLTAPTATDNCAGSITATTSDPVTYSVPGEYSVTWTFDDGNGNTTEQKQQLSFAADETAPVPNAGSPLPPDFNEIQKVLASDKAAGDEFGNSISISDKYAIVGAFSESDGTTSGNGAAYIFERDASGNWTEVQKLLASDKANQDEFGNSVSISGNYAIVGAWKDDNETGSAYIFERDARGNWAEAQKLVALDRNRYDNFGSSVSVSGDHVIVGASRESDIGLSDNGAAYIFERDASGNWTEVQKLLASDKASSDFFGNSVSISGDHVIVGAPREDDGGLSDNGAAYIFERNALGSWIEVEKLLASDKAGNDLFGESVSISGDYAIVGAVGEDDGGSGAGAAYVFERDALGNWSETQKLLASDREGGDSFGFNVSISGDRAIVGALTKNDGGIPRSGAAYVFARLASGNWGEVEKLLASDKARYDFFGVSVSISSDYAIVGAFRETDGATSLNGAAYIFKNVAGWELPNVHDQYCGSNSLTLTAPTATDNCVGTMVATTNDPTTFASPGDYIVTWTFDDGNGNIIEQVQEVIFSPDEETPVPDAGSLLPPDFAEMLKTQIPNQRSRDELGYSVSISGDYAIVGAYGEDYGLPRDCGVAYIYERDAGGNWINVQRLLASDKAAYDNFGYSVAISGDYAIVGAYKEDDGTTRDNGAAYIFERDASGNWIEVQKLLASQKANDGYFGSRVSISGDYAIVGAFREDDGKTDNGAAYIFKRDASGKWNEEERLLASDRDHYDYFGHSVSISDGYAIVGAYRQGDGGLYRNGAAYVFERDASGSWTEKQKLLASDKASNDGFGWSVSVSGNYLIVGATGETDAARSYSGAAYIFERDASGTWAEQQKLLASDKAPRDYFGNSVSISNDRAVVGAYLKSTGTLVEHGAAYVFERNATGNWNEVQKLLPVDNNGDDHFGNSVSISGDYIIAGAPEEDDNGYFDNGAAYFFENEPAWVFPPIQEQYCGSNSISLSVPTATDNCTGSLTATTSDQTNFTVPGSYRVTWTYDDGNGNIMKQYQKVDLIADDIAPVPDAGSSPPPSDFNEIKKALASDKDTYDHFGRSVSVSGDYAIMGADTESDGVTSQNGAAYIYERDASGNWTEVQKLLASNKASYAHFGWSVSISGDYAIVGAYKDSDAMRSYSGAAYIFERDANGNWNEVEKLLASNKESAGYFGYSVSISGNNAIVGASRESNSGTTSNGAAYAFVRGANGNWSELQKLNASDQATNDLFGWSVSMSSDYIIIGAAYQDEGGTSDNGAAYIFERDVSGSWTEVQKVVASDKATRDYFGYSLSVSGGYVIVGAYNESDGTTSLNGAAYIFERDASGNWTEVQKLLASDKALFDYFGWSVSISGDHAIVGAPLKSDGGITQNGAAYIFERDASGNWNELEKLLASDKADSDNFGLSVAISGANAIVGAPVKSDGGLNSNGAAYFYESAANWTLPSLSTNCNSASLPTPTATDNCAGNIIGVPSGATSFSGPGLYQVIWTFDDGNGNITKQVQEVSISAQLSTVMQAFSGNICSGGRINIASLIRDYSMRIRRVNFYDKDPGQGGQLIGNCRMSRGQARSGDKVMVKPAKTHTYWATYTNAQGCYEYLSVVVTVDQSCMVITSVIARLEGAYDPASGTMRTSLNTANLIPSQEPYTGLGYTFTGGGGETMTAAAQSNPDIVDWVILELRDTANPATVVHSRAALLLKNGLIVDVNGTSAPQLNVNSAMPYYLAVVHRNHLGVMTKEPVFPWEQIDFSHPNMEVYGGQNARSQQSGTSLMTAGDADGNGQIQNTDDILEWIPSVGTAGYKSGDYNLDGQVQNSDRVMIWMRNVGRGTAVPQ
ncbi:MAG: FG-GAP repeat protein [Bacteroidia bacterium]